MRHRRRIVLSCGLAVAMTPLAGCHLDSVLGFLRDGAVERATDVINGIFENRFGLPPSGVEDFEEQESGDDLFVRL